MKIAVAGRYSADTGAEREANFDAMNQAAARVLEMGHTPLIGVNAALPVVERADVIDPYEAIMQISMAVVSTCDAILLISHSRGADRELDHFVAAGKPIYYAVEQVPEAKD